MTLIREISRSAFAVGVLAIAASLLSSQTAKTDCTTMDYVKTDAGNELDELALQQTTNTNCTTTGSNTNCTSTTSNPYQEGQQIGSAIGYGIGAAMAAHKQTKWVRKYCAAHPGADWRWFNTATGRTIDRGRCPTDEDISVAAANEFMAHHHDYIKNQTNSKLVTDYLDTHRLDPRREQSYEVAYKDLRKAGKLELYAR